MENVKKYEIISAESKQQEYRQKKMDSFTKDRTVKGTNGFPGPQNCVTKDFKGH